ncbi:MAG TPA: hypothetical protein VHF25_12915 [Nitriliruptorales bacterium]|nr:hypothetical protein [Nitriliruptorales bacterium]
MAERADRPRILPDDLPKRELFREPVRVDGIEVGVEDLDDGRRRVSFRVQVRDADGAPCPDLAVDGRITGPHRSGEKMGHTDLFGQVRFRMAGPPGTYRFDVVDVAAGALALVRAAPDGVATLEVSVP